MTVDLFAAVPVRDYKIAVEWYERLFGSPPAFFPNDIEAVWEVAEHRYLYIEEVPERAGCVMNTIYVDDLDARIADIAERGLKPAKLETYEKGTVRDADGNEAAVGGGTSESE